MDEIEPVACACRDCGIPYQDFGADLTLPHDQWDAVSEGAPLLCGTCICRRVRAMDGSIAVRAVIEFSQPRTAKQAQP